MNIQESFVGKTSKKRATDIVPRKLELDEQSFFSLLRDYTNSLGITNVDKGVIIDNIIVQKEVKRYYKPETASVGSFTVSLVVSPYSYFWGRATEIPVFDLKFKVLFYSNKNEVRIGIYVNDYKADCCRRNGASNEVIPRHFFRKSDGRFLDKVYDFFHRPEKFFELTKMGVDTDTLAICKNYIKLIADFEIEPEKGVGVLDLPNDSLEDDVTKVQSIFGTELFHLEENVLESFTKKISSKKNTDLISEPSFGLDDGVYILHETLGVKSFEGWNKTYNNGVIGILLVDDEHQIVIALEDSPNKLHWSKERKLFNQPIEDIEDAESDFNGEEYCKNLNSPEFPAAYYCLNYNKGSLDWYLPSTGEWKSIYRHFEEIQTALSIVGGQKFVIEWDSYASPWYWSSTESGGLYSWVFDFFSADLFGWCPKVGTRCRVRPVSNFRKKNTLKESFMKKIKSSRKNTLKESFTKKISSKKNTDLISEPAFVADGVYILHETLGVRCVEGWNPKFNNGVVGILLIEDDHKFVISLEDSPDNLHWSKERKLVNRLIDNIKDTKSDFNGEEYCRNLNSPDFPAAYYCLNYNKGGRDWYLPSSGELWMICSHFEEIQTALLIVGGQEFATKWDGHSFCYWSSTECNHLFAWSSSLVKKNEFGLAGIKDMNANKVRPISKFQPSELKESFTKKIRKSNSKEMVQDADDKAFNPLMDAKEFVNRMEECILSYKQPYVYGKKNPYNLEKFSFEMLTSWPNTFKFNRKQYISRRFSELLFDVSNSKKPSFRITLKFFWDINKDDHTRNIICYLMVEPVGHNKGNIDDRLFQYIYDSKKKRISFVENPEGVRFEDNMELIEPTLRNLNFILNDIRFLMDNWKILYKTYLKKDSFETWNEFYKMLPSQNNKGFDFDLKESFVHKISKKTSDSLEGGEMFGEMESFGEFDMLFKRFLKKHEHQFSSCLTTDYPFKSMSGKIGYKVVLKKDCPFEDGSDDTTTLRFVLDVFQGGIMNFPEDDDLNTPHGILTPAFFIELGTGRPQQIYFSNLEFVGERESLEDFRFDKFKERREWEKPNYSYRLLFGFEKFLLALVKTVNNMDEQTWSEIGRTSANFKPFKGEACCGNDSKIILDILDNHGFYSELHKNFSKVNLADLNESFTKKISSKKNTDLISKPSFVLEDGVYILHETLGVRGVDGWNTKFNNGVVGILVVEDEHQIVVALEDSPEKLLWSEERQLVNRPVDIDKNAEGAKSDFNGEEYCRNLNSPDFPAAYYCLNYNKGGRNWYLPSTGELWLIYQHIEEVQSALSIVGGQRFVTEWKGGDSPWYWSSTELNATDTWFLDFHDKKTLGTWYSKFDYIGNVRPVFNFRKKNTLKESFTKKISSKKNSDLISEQSFVLEDGVYILHETLGVKTVEGWNKKFNNDVVGILVVEDEHQIVIALEDSPVRHRWSKKYKLVNRPVDGWEDAVSDFNGERYCRNLNSPEFPAAYYCLNYKKGGRDWYLPSAGELWLIHRHLEEIQNTLSIVGGQEFVTTWGDDVPCYWSSTENNGSLAWAWDDLTVNGGLRGWFQKVSSIRQVRPVSNFRKNTLKESFTKKISSKKNTDLISKPAFVADGVYILHETLGVKTVDSWNPKDNKGVVGVLLVEDDHKIVVALEDAPENLLWSKKRELINEPVRYKDVESYKDAESDFNGEEHCINLNSPDFPAAYYCLKYKKGDRNWYLPSAGELGLIYNHLEEIQNVLEIVGGQKFATNLVEGVTAYWSSTEMSNKSAWYKGFSFEGINFVNKDIFVKVRPVSKFEPSVLRESFTRKISRQKNNELISKSDTAFEIPDGVYILHETLGVRTVDGWNPEDNEGVVGILLIEDGHKIVISLEDSPEELHWSKEHKLVNQPVKNDEDAESDFNGEEYCKNLNSPDFPAAYYCLNYKKGGRDWFLPSSGELCMICRRHLEEIQSALSIVGGQKFVTDWKGRCVPLYWSSTEYSDDFAWHMNFDVKRKSLYFGYSKIGNRHKVRPISKFQPSELKESFTKKIKSSRKNTLKESFTKKISSKKNTDLISEPSFVLEDGVYILHESLRVKTVDSWNTEFNEGVVGILLIEDDHKIVISLEDSPENLLWSKRRKFLVNRPDFEDEEDAKSDFDGEEYCKNLNSPEFPAAYYCLNYKKGGRKWYLPSAGELLLIYRHLKEIQTALSIVGGKKFVTEITEWEDDENDVPCYWSSTEYSDCFAWALEIGDGCLSESEIKYYYSNKVRPISKFQPSELKESFTKKIKTKGRKEIIGQSDNLVIDYENLIKGLIKKYGFSTIHKYVLSLIRGTGYKEPPYVRRHEPFTEDKMVTILGELEFDKSEMSDNDITVTWRKTKKFHYRSPIVKTEKFSELSVDEKRGIYEYLINWLNVRIDEDEKIEKMDKLPQPSRNVV